MSTNYYRIPKPSEVRIKYLDLVEQINDIDIFSPANIYSEFRTVERGFDNLSPWDVFLENMKIHIGKRSSGWKFLWNFQDGKLLELTHITPKIKPQPENKIEELFRKVDAFEKLLTRYMDLEIDKVIIEEPLLNSNNVNTVGTLLRFNGMISKVVDDVLGVVPEFISSYDSRSHAFPELMSIRTQDKKGILYKEKDLKSKKPYQRSVFKS